MIVSELNTPGSCLVISTFVDGFLLCMIRFSKPLQCMAYMS